LSVLKRPRASPPWQRRFTGLTNAHSKKIENHQHAFALHAVFYNFAKVNQAIRVTPAMEAGISDHIWSITWITSCSGRRQISKTSWSISGVLHAQITGRAKAGYAPQSPIPARFDGNQTVGPSLSDSRGYLISPKDSCSLI